MEAVVAGDSWDLIDPHTKQVINTTDARTLWIKLLEAVSMHEIEWSWVKGHEGNEGNEIADRLATQAILDAKINQ